MISSLLTLGLSFNLIGWRGIVFLLQQPIMYCILMNTCRKRTVIWVVTILSLWLTDKDWIIVSSPTFDIFFLTLIQKHRTLAKPPYNFRLPMLCLDESII